MPPSMADASHSRRICAAITIDVDMIDHVAAVDIDEFAHAVPFWSRIAAVRPWLRATWFVRLDRQIAARFGSADALFRHHAETWTALRGRGHELAWHLHAFRLTSGQWTPEHDEAAVAEEMETLHPRAAEFGVRGLRMGWGFHTNRTMRQASNLGFVYDSSAIPRPRYPWDTCPKDWSISPPGPYRPSQHDFRVPGDNALPIWEIPMSVSTVVAPYDKQQVQRCLNPAYHPQIFRTAVRTWLTHYRWIVLTTHPYESQPRNVPHGLLAFSEASIADNLDWLAATIGAFDGGGRFVTLADFIEEISPTVAGPTP